MTEESKKLKEAKILGGIGGILVLLGGILKIGFFAPLAGFILLILGVKRISQVLEKREIFRDYIISAVFFILGWMMVVVLFILIWGGLIEIWSGLREIGFLSKFNKEIFEALSKFGIGFLVGFLISWVFLVLGSYFLRKSFRMISQGTGVEFFKIAGDLAFLGSILTIILVGGVIEFIASILTVVAFFSLPNQLPKQTETVHQT